MTQKAVFVAADLAPGSNAIGGRLFRRFRGRDVTYWRAPTVLMRDEDALIVALSSVARPIL